MIEEYSLQETACALPSLRPIAYALAALVIAAALTIALINKLRPW